MGEGKNGGVHRQIGDVSSLSRTPPVESVIDDEAHQTDTNTDTSMENKPVQIEDEDGGEGADSLNDSLSKPLVKSSIRFMMKDGTIGQARVLSTQPKQNSVWKDWLNVQLVDKEKPSSVNWKEIQWWRNMEEVEHPVFLTSAEEYEQKVMDAKEREIDNFHENNVFKEVDDVGQQTISCRWVYTEKEKDGETVLKARLVARGFEEDFKERTDSPTCSRQALRMIFTVSSTCSWDLHSLDVTSAFLQGGEITRDVFIESPKEFREDGKVWKLRRCIYGLNDAPREWYNKVVGELLHLGGKKSSFDNTMFMWHDNTGQLKGILVMHVDDFVYCGTSEWLSSVIGSLVKTFKISKQEKGSFSYIGLDVVQTNDTVLVDQNSYVDSLKPVKLSTQRKAQKSEVLSSEERKMLRSISGQLLWVTSQTRPDVAYESCRVSNYGSSPTVRSLIEANKAIMKLKAQKLRLSFPNLGCPENVSVVVYGDASHANLPSGASQGAYVVFLLGNNKIAPITWKSKKLDRVTKSPLGSETMALAESGDAGHFIAMMTKEIFSLDKLPNVICYTDSKSLVEHLQSNKLIQDLRLRVDIARIREMIQLNEISVVWIDTTKQLADSLTKAGASAARLVEVLEKGTF